MRVRLGMRNSRSLLRFLLGLGCAFNNAAARPSTVTWADYNQLSTAFFQSVNNVLTGAESGKDAVLQLHRSLTRLALLELLAVRQGS